MLEKGVSNVSIVDFEQLYNYWAMNLRIATRPFLNVCLKKL